MPNRTLKVAVPSLSQDGLNAVVNPRFGRCEFFTIVQIENDQIKEVVVVPNPGINAMGGAGPLAVQTLIKEGIQAIAGGDYGPNAMSALLQAGVNIYGYPANLANVTVKAVIELVIQDKLSSMSQANMPSHSGMGGGMGGGGRGRGGGGMGQGQGRWN